MAQNHLEDSCSLTEQPNMLPTTGSWLLLTAFANAVSSSSSLILYATREKAELIRRETCISGSDVDVMREKAEFIVRDGRIVDGVSGPPGTTVTSDSSDRRSYTSRGAYVSCSTMKLLSATIPTRPYRQGRIA